MEHLTVRELMISGIVSVSNQTPVVDVAKALRDHQVSCVVIDHSAPDSGGAFPLGIITEHDIVRSLADCSAGEAIQRLCAADIMSAPLVTLNANATLHEALTISQARGIRHIPIVDDRRTVIGLVTQTELARAHFRLIDQQRESIEQSIRHRTAELAASNEVLSDLALQDDVLAIGNRRALEVDVYVNHANAMQSQSAYVLALLELDNFRGYVKHYGDAAGDAALCQVSATIKESLRYGDRHYRYGEDSFAVLMPDTGRFEAVEAMNRLIENIEMQNIEHDKNAFGHVTASVGLGVGEASLQRDWQDVLEESSTYLSQAKTLGCNQVCFAVDELSEATRSKNPLQFLLGG
ncbi:hypothetical protein NBRC116494_03360 [Aurantivibrio plasticivorans]